MALVSRGAGAHGLTAQSPSTISLRLSAPLPTELGSKSSSAPLLVKPLDVEGTTGGGSVGGVGVRGVSVRGRAAEDRRVSQYIGNPPRALRCIFPAF